MSKWRHHIIITRNVFVSGSVRYSLATLIYFVYLRSAQGRIKVGAIDAAALGPFLK